MPTSPLASSAKNPIRVLYVEDHTNMRSIMAECMQRAGYQVETAEDGVEGWAKFRASPFDLVITDLYMPNRDGFGFIQLVRNSKRPVRVIVYSSAIRETNLTALGELAVDASVSKESNWEALHATILTVLRSNA